VLDRFSADERARIGVHTCPGGDQDSTHSADVDYSQLLPTLFELNAGAFYLELAGEDDPESVLGAVGETRRPEQRVFVGVTEPIDPTVETPDEVRDRVLLAAEYIPLDRPAPRTTAASRRSATTPRPPARRRSQRSAPACRAHNSQANSSASEPQ
jgi:5-methyltetrahydropteroyltriglutamate--homocysteine methyltransferase